MVGHQNGLAPLLLSHPEIPPFLPGLYLYILEKCGYS